MPDRCAGTTGLCLNLGTHWSVEKLMLTGRFWESAQEYLGSVQLRGELKTVFVPSGTSENSPPFQRWVCDRIHFESPVRDER